MITTANITLDECMQNLKKLCASPVVYTDQIPAVLQQDFNNFIAGRGLSTDTKTGRIITHDIKAYFDKVMYRSGIDYPVQWQC